MRKELELYVHIPFCICKCQYCDFLSGPASKEEVDEYVDALIQEIKSYHEKMAEYSISSIFLGGGTPSILNTKQIRRLFESIRETFIIEDRAEITIEVNPGTATKEKLQCWKECGINRLSIGLQSVNDDELKMLGRIHTYAQFKETYYTAREVGFENINIDLISAIPGQNLLSWKETLRKVAVLEPEHISAYSLIIEEGTPFYDNYEQYRELLPSEEEERRMYEETENILREFGYHRYEISNYAKEGYECRHNCGYWKGTEYLGVGLGAASLINHQRFSVIRDRKQYVECVNHNTLAIELMEQNLYENRERLSKEDEIEEFMFLGLRMMDGISKKEFCARFHVEINDIYENVIEDLKNKELLEEMSDNIRLTKRGIDISNMVFSEFLL